MTDDIIYTGVRSDTSDYECRDGELDIALGVGYNNVSSFNYAFAKFAGMSPSQFRSRYAGRRAMGAARSTHPTSPR